MFNKIRVATAAVAIAITFSAQGLAAGGSSAQSVGEHSTPGPRTGQVGISVIRTATSAGTQEAMVVAGGSWFTRRYLAHNAVLVLHPKGNLLIDTGLGKEIESQFQEMGFLDRQLFAYDEHSPAADQLTDHPDQRGAPHTISHIVPTHMHWDHASGIEDFPSARVWIRSEEYQQAINGEPPAFLKSQYDSSDIQWQTLVLSKRPVYGFARSHDFYGDGRVIVVDLSGHTAGQVGVIVKVDSGRKYFFIGDTTWTLKGVDDNADRPGFLSLLVKFNYDDEKNLSRINALHQLRRDHPDMIVVPAHDELVTRSLPQFPDIGY